MKIVAFIIIGVFSLSVSAQQTEICSEVTKKLAVAERKLNDWAELDRYRSANAQIVPPRKGENRVVFIGDSITDSWTREGFGGFFPGRPYIDRGISGQTTSQMLLRFRADVIDLQPSVVVILAGTNDIAGNTGPMSLKETGDNIAAMSELATAHGIRVVLSSVMPVSDTVRHPDGAFYTQTQRRPPTKIIEMDEWIIGYASRNGYTYLNYYDAMVDENGFMKDGLTVDGLHPNAKGYAIMTPLAEVAIRVALRRKK